MLYPLVTGKAKEIKRVTRLCSFKQCRNTWNAELHPFKSTLCNRVQNGNEWFMMQELKLCICSSPVTTQRHFYLSWRIIIPSCTSLRASHWGFPRSIWPLFSKAAQTKQEGTRCQGGNAQACLCFNYGEENKLFWEMMADSLMISLMEACLGEWSVFQYSGNNELPSVGSAVFKKPFSFCSTVISQATPILSNMAQGKKTKCMAVQPIIMDNKTHCAKQHFTLWFRNPTVWSTQLFTVTKQHRFHTHTRDSAPASASLTFRFTQHFPLDTEPLPWPWLHQGTFSWGFIL